MTACNIIRLWHNFGRHIYGKASTHVTHRRGQSVIPNYMPHHIMRYTNSGTSDIKTGKVFT